MQRVYSFAKIDQLEKIPPAPGTNQIAGFIEFCPVMNWKKSKIHFSRALKMVLYKFSTNIKCCLLITFSSSYFPRLRDPTFSRPAGVPRSHVQVSPRSTSSSSKSRHVPVPLLVTAILDKGLLIFLPHTYKLFGPFWGMYHFKQTVKREKKNVLEHFPKELEVGLLIHQNCM